jgi:hypothetical protein
VEEETDLSRAAIRFPPQQSGEKSIFLLPTRPNLDGKPNIERTERLSRRGHIGKILASYRRRSAQHRRSNGVRKNRILGTARRVFSRHSMEPGGKGSFQAVKLQRPARTTVCSHSTRDMAAKRSIKLRLDCDFCWNRRLCSYEQFHSSTRSVRVHGASLLLRKLVIEMTFNIVTA